jgi:hypothetical protein
MLGVDPHAVEIPTTVQAQAPTSKCVNHVIQESNTRIHHDCPGFGRLCRMRCMGILLFIRQDVDAILPFEQLTTEIE